MSSNNKTMSNREVKDQVDLSHCLGYYLGGFDAAVNAVRPYMNQELAIALQKAHPLYGGGQQTLTQQEIVYFKKLAQDLGLGNHEQQ